MKGPEEVMQSIYGEWWPPGYDSSVLSGAVKRHAFNMSLVLSAVGNKATICDIGGGWGAFAAGCAALGMKAILIDDFKDAGFFKTEDPRHEMPGAYGVTVLTRDVIRDGLDLSTHSIDVFTIFDSMEHWHHSPKKFLAQVMRALRPKGFFFLSAPNCVNLRKRLTVPFGIGKWSSMAEWYETNSFRGHVRELDVDDLKYIARDMGLVGARVYGRNWSGIISQKKVIRILAILTDRLLRLWPSLCSDLYLVGRKP